jgi:hypothetical protein
MSRFYCMLMICRTLRSSFFSSGPIICSNTVTLLCYVESSPSYYWLKFSGGFHEAKLFLPKRMSPYHFAQSANMNIGPELRNRPSKLLKQKKKRYPRRTVCKLFDTAFTSLKPTSFTNLWSTTWSTLTSQRTETNLQSFHQTFSIISIPKPRSIPSTSSIRQ